jgi:D-hydroxyproline dehydrogenase subunit beta
VGHPELSNSYDIAVIGGGIVGAACFNELAGAGARVCLIEPSIIGGGATAAGMGHITAMDDSDAQFALTRYSQTLWKDLAGRLPPEAEYLSCGAIWIASDDEEMAEVERKFHYYRERDAPVEVLSSRALASLEPNLRPGLAGGLLVRDDTVVYPPAVAAYLVLNAQESGASVILGKRVSRIEGDRAELSDGSTVRARCFVLATGIAAAALAPEADVVPRKGHLVITDRYPGLVSHQLIELGYLKSAHSLQTDSVAFNVQPRPTGQVLIGSSRQFGCDEPAVDNRVLSRMLARTFEYMPALRKCSALRSWTGFRAATPDKLPLIGPSLHADNVLLATGHEGLGITTSLGTAKLIANLLLGTTCGTSVLPYLPKRSFAHA